jgi:hypothetical protein
MASNVQRGTLKMDAGDWIRLKRLGGARYMYSNNTPVSKDVINPPPRLETRQGARHVYTEFGTSRIRRPASNYIDYTASQVADYIVQSSTGTCGVGQSLTATRVCSCSLSKDAIKHNGLCVDCKK